MLEELDQIEDEGINKITHTVGHIKKEITMKHGWPRLISARDQGLRNLSAVPYDHMIHQVYDNPHFIKHKTDDEVGQILIEKAREYKYVICLDISSYDSAQQGILWEIEQ